MNTKDYLNKVAYKETVDLCMDGKLSDIYSSKFDGSYITHVGLEKSVKFMADKEITEELTHGVGFSPKDKKWYGWSHRAIYGFEIGSTCKKGDCHYTPKQGEWTAKTMEDAKQMAVDFNKGVS